MLKPYEPALQSRSLLLPERHGAREMGLSLTGGGQLQ